MRGFIDTSSTTEVALSYTFKNFQSLREEFKDTAGSFESPVMTIADMHFWLCIFPSGLAPDDDDDDAPDEDEVHVVLQCSSPQSVSCLSKVSAVQHGGRMLEILGGNKDYKVSGWDSRMIMVNGYPISFAKLVKEGYLANDELKVHVGIILVTGSNFDNPISQQTAFDLRGDVEKLWEDSTHADIVLEVDSTEFKAHRALLSCRSPVFKQMFETDMNESKSGRVMITDIDTNTFKDFLSFMYAAQIPGRSLSNIGRLG